MQSLLSCFVRRGGERVASDCFVVSLAHLPKTSAVSAFTGPLSFALGASDPFAFFILFRASSSSEIAGAVADGPYNGGPIH